MKKIVSLLFLVSLIIFCGKSKQENNQTTKTSLSGLLPDSDKLNIEMIDEPRTFDSNNLWEYINGAADNFLNYGFQKVITSEYQYDGIEFVVDIYEMQDKKRAFGIYASERSTDINIIDIGSEAYAGGGALVFWKNKYYVKIISYEDTEQSEQLIKKVAENISKNIPKDKTEMKELNWFPEKRMKKNSKRFIAQNIAGLEFLNNGYTAEYKENGNSFKVFIIDCEKSNKAREKLNLYRNHIINSGNIKSDLLSYGEDGFIGNDKYYGNVLAAKIENYLVLIIGYEDITLLREYVEEIDDNIKTGF